MRKKYLLYGTVAGFNTDFEGKTDVWENQPSLTEAEAELYRQPTEDLKQNPQFTPFERVAVEDALPGQDIKFLCGSCGRGRRHGKMTEVVRHADYEIEPRCPHAEQCAGCRFQTVPYEKELEWKREKIARLMEPVLEIPNATKSDIPLEITPSPTTDGYRNKMEYSFGDTFKGGPLALGHHKKNAYHDILPTEHCQIVDEDFNTILTATIAYFTQANVSFYNTYSGQGYLRHLVMRRSYGNGTLLLNLETTSQATGLDETALLQGFCSALLALALKGKVAGILHSVNDQISDVVRADTLTLLYGQDHLTEKLCVNGETLQFKISPFSFFQTNTHGAERLYGLVADMAQKVPGGLANKTVFDLYCGTGTIAQIIAKTTGAREVWGIELVAEAVAAAKQNAALNGLTNCHFFAGDVLAYVDTLAQSGASHPDLIILDPPRDGIHPKALPKILAYAPQAFIYVSCKPTSLTRDLPAFIEAGYQIQEIRACDMFPRTEHVETVVLMSRNNGRKI